MSLIAAFATAAARYPRKVALITEKSQLTYDDLLNLVQAFDMELMTRGVRAGQLIVLAEKRPEFCIALALLASLRSLTMVYASPQLMQATAVPFDRVLTIAPIDGLRADQQIIITPDWFTALGTLPLPDYRDRTDCNANYIFQSSGTTGTPKLIRGTEADRLESARRGIGLEGVTLTDRRFMSTLGPGTGWGMSANLAAFLVGGSVVALGDDQEKLLQYIDLYRIDTLNTTPAMILRMIEVDNAAQYLTSVRDIRLGGALAGAELLQSFGRHCGARLHIGYGAAEVGPCFRAIFDPTAVRGPGYVGKFIRDDLEVAFFDNQMVLMPGADEGIVGFRVLSGPSSRAYLATENSDHAGFFGEYFVPGDVMRREGDDYFLIGRMKNIINFSGNKFSLEAIQQVLEQAFPGEVLVPLVDPGADGLERLSVIHKAASDISPEQLTALLRPKFAGLEVRRAIRVQHIPLTESGKVDGAALRQKHLAN